jgi:glycosyltransferase involved in cell wall biosynthesis
MIIVNEEYGNGKTWADGRRSIKVVQTVHSKFHHFDLARQLHRQGMLEAIFTGYPRWKLRDEQLPPHKIRTFPWLRTFIMAKGRFGIENPWFDRELNWWAAVLLDAYVASHLPACDVFVALSGGGLTTAGVVQRRGGGYICDRGSTHIRYAERIMAEEFQRWGQRLPEIDPRSIEREELEYSAADIITVPSEFCVRSFVEMGVPAEKLRKIPYGVDLNMFSKVADPPTDRFEVLFVGQVSFRKGLPYLLEAFKALKHPRKRLRVIGAMQPEMRRFLQNRSTEDVDFIGPIPQGDLVAIMSSSHVMVLPSIEDGLGLVLAQAMACGCPIICSTNTGGEELLCEVRQASVVPIRNPEAIRNRLEQFCQDRCLREKASWDAIQAVKRPGGWDTYGSRYAEVCQELVRKSVQSN